MSRVMGRFSRPPPIIPKTKFLTESRQCSCCATHALKRSENLGRSRSRCAVYAYLYGAAGDLGMRLYELVGLVPASAVVALVAPGLLVAAHGTRPLDVAVRQKASLGRAVHLLALGFRDVAALL